MQPHYVPAGRPTAGRGLGLLALVVATIWLAASIAAGVWLFTGTKSGGVHLNAAKPTLTARSTSDVYGGDAYTGIQNAASDTEHAVVDSANGMSQFNQELANSSAEFDRGLTNRLQQGLAVVIIGVGVLTFVVALSRFAAAAPSAISSTATGGARVAPSGMGGTDLWEGRAGSTADS